MTEETMDNKDVAEVVDTLGDVAEVAGVVDAVTGMEEIAAAAEIEDLDPPALHPALTHDVRRAVCLVLRAAVGYPQLIVRGARLARQCVQHLRDRHAADLVAERLRELLPPHVEG